MPHRRSPAAEGRLVLGVVVCTTALVTLFVTARPDLAFTSAFLFQDQGNHLLVAARLAEGAVLYRDVAYPYGPLPALLGSALAWSGGISARSFVVLQALLNAAFLGLLAHGLGRHVPSRAAAVIVLLGVLPLSMAPSATAGGAASNTYIGLERLVLVVLLLSWTPPEERTKTSSIVAGVTLGLWQLVKVGGAAVALGAWLVVDALSALGGDRATWRRLARGWTLMACVALAVEACRWTTLFATLPAPIAFDVAWPWYTLEHYRSIPRAVSGRGLTGVEFATHAAVPLASLGVAAIGLGRQLGDLGGRRALALLVPSLFFVCGWPAYFGHREIMWQYAWAAVPGAAFALAHAGRVQKVGAFLITMPAVGLLLASIAGAIRVSATEPLRMPNGDTLWLNAAARAAADETMALLGADRASRGPTRTLVLPSGGGLYFYAGAALPTRHPWVIEKYIRPYEFEVVRDQVGPIDRVVLLNEPGITVERLDECVRAILGPAVADLWKGRVSRIDHRAGWSLVTLEATTTSPLGVGPAPR